jgi:hypothetical protein
MSRQTGIIPDFSNKFGLLKEVQTNDLEKTPQGIATTLSFGTETKC